MFCPACGVENKQESSRFCRACGADLRAVSRALSQSLPVKLATTLDAYLENRYQQNLRSGVVNLVAFIALFAVGLGHLYFAWIKTGAFMLGLAGLALFFGVWDIWIYRRNLPPTAKQSSLPAGAQANEPAVPETGPPLSVAEPTTMKLGLITKVKPAPKLTSTDAERNRG